MSYPIKSIPHSGSIQETLNQPTLYIFEGKIGQSLTLNIGDGTLKVEVLTPSGEGLATLYSGEWKGFLPEAGIYRVMVDPRNELTHSALKIDLGKNTEVQLRQNQLQDWRLSEYVYRSNHPILFQDNELETTVDISLYKQHIQPLTFSAHKGQLLMIKAHAVTLAIKSPRGQLLDLQNGEVSAMLPQDGVYQVLVIGEDYAVTTPVTLHLQ